MRRVSLRGLHGLDAGFRDPAGIVATVSRPAGMGRRVARRQPAGGRANEPSGLAGRRLRNRLPTLSATLGRAGRFRWGCAWCLEDWPRGDWLGGGSCVASIRLSGSNTRTLAQERTPALSYRTGSVRSGPTRPVTSAELENADRQNSRDRWRLAERGPVAEASHLQPPRAAHARRAAVPQRAYPLPGAVAKPSGRAGPSNPRQCGARRHRVRTVPQRDCPAFDKIDVDPLL